MVRFCLIVVFAVLLTCTPVQTVEAADFNINFRLYAVDGILTGDFSWGEQVAFRLQVGENSSPVMMMQRGVQKNILTPDVMNGMFLIRVSKD